MKKPLVFEHFDQVWAMRPDVFEQLLAAENAWRKQTAEAMAAGSAFVEKDALYENDRGVAIIPVEGVITRNGSGGWRYMDMASQKSIAAMLDAALADSGVKAILFAIHSPGGIATGTQELASAIFEAKKVKPCAAWVDGLCCSAAYWLASATGKVYAGPSSTVGSIGVILKHGDWSAFNKEIGVSYTYITAGSYKAVGNEDNPLSQNDLRVLQQRVDQIYEMFTQDVAQRMGLALDNRLDWADGRDFLATDAHGLVTQVLPSVRAAVDKLLEETFMDKNELAAKHPDLLASIQKEVREAAMEEINQIKTQSAQAAVKCVLKMVENLGGAEYANKARILLNAKITPDQFQALFEAGAFAQKQTQSPSADSRGQILDALLTTGNRELQGGGALDETSAAIRRMATM